MERKPLTLPKDSVTLPSFPWRHHWKTWVVLPAFNEAENLGPLLERIDFAMNDAHLDYQILVVDDGSSDETVKVAQKYSEWIPVRVERHMVNQGLGNTIRDGLLVASEVCGENDVIVVMDADNTHAPGLIVRMIRVIQEGADVTIASRYQSGSLVKGVSFLRQVLSIGASLLFRLVFPIQGVRDYTCGYRAYRASALKQAFQSFGREFIDQAGFQSMVDILLKLRSLDLVFREVPLILRYDFKRGASKMKIVRTITSTLLLMFRRRFWKTHQITPNLKLEFKQGT